jgi:hypothetical protein
MFDALHAAQVPAELHVFEKGGHGWGLGAPGTLVAQWPQLFAKWARSHGFMNGALPAPAAVATPAASRDDSEDEDERRED